MEKEKRRSSKSNKSSKSSSKTGSGKSSSKSSSRRESKSDDASTPAPAPAPLSGGRPPSLRGTHNRPWQREASNARNNVAADDDYYDFASMDVVMAPVPPGSPVPSPVSAPALLPAAAAPARSVAPRIPSPRTSPIAMSSKSASPTADATTVSAYELYRQKNKRPGSLSASSSTSPSEATSTASFSGADSKLSSYERYRQHRQKQQQTTTKSSPTMASSSSTTSTAASASATSRPLSLSATGSVSKSSARSPPATRQVFTYDSSEEATKTKNTRASTTPVSPYGKTPQPDDDNDDDAGGRQRAPSYQPFRSSEQAASLTGGANELKAALKILQTKKEQRVSGAGISPRMSFSPKSTSARDLRKSRLSAVAATMGDRPADAPDLDSPSESSRPPPAPRSGGTPVVPRSRSPMLATRERTTPIDDQMPYADTRAIPTLRPGDISQRRVSEQVTRPNPVEIQQRSASLSSVPTGGSGTALPPTGRHSATALAGRSTGWSTMSHRKSDSEPIPAVPSTFMSQNSKVGKYLATRNAQRYSVTDGSQRGGGPLVDPKSESPADNRRSGASSISSMPWTSDDSSEGENSDDMSSDDGGEDLFHGSGSAEGWSVRVCIVSAVDFPINVVPNLPLSPVLRVALVPLPDEEGPEPKVTDKDRLQRSINSSGVASVKKARIRCTSSKVTSKRDNGSVEFHEEMRWDYVENPQRTALAIELSARAVMTPANIRESPYSQNVQPIQFSSTGRGSDSSIGQKGGIGSIFRQMKHKKASSEMETAHAAAAVAKHLVDDDDTVANSDSPSVNASQRSSNNQSEMEVKLRERKRRKKAKLTDDIRLGSQVIPLSDLHLKKPMEGGETARIEQWFQLETSHSLSVTGPDPSFKTPAKRNPSILLEISFSSHKALDESEDDMDEVTEKSGLELKASFSRRASIKIRNQLKKETKPAEVVPKEEEPVLEPGIVDYVCIVGARDIGDQKSDDGSSGWVNTTPECVLLEQFPPSADYLAKSGRNAALPDKVEWFCFPEGCRLWRGTTPPNSEELNLKRFSASSPANMSTTIASFDACLGCTTSFSWFVLSSNSDEYGSVNSKMYGACIRFYVPAPVGIDQTQDDFAQFGAASASSQNAVHKRLWVPLGLLVTSSMPIVGVLEMVLLRMCEALSSPGRRFGNEEQPPVERIYEDIMNLATNFHKPIPGLVQCSVPFLTGEPLKISLASSSGLPTLPHGNSITSVCRLLGAEGLVFLLSAMLTESKILLHSDDTSNVSLVAEVATALLYPFSWSLPYIPILPFAMMEFIEAPMPYLVGIPSCNYKMLDPFVLEEVVVIDLDRDITDGDYFDEPQGDMKTKIPTPLPLSTASNISKAVYRLLQADTGFDANSQVPDANGRTFPRIQDETNIEREFRIAVAMEVCGLVRGFQDCLVYASSSQPMFNVDKFLQSAPILFEEQRGTTAAATPRQIISPRSRRFMSIFTNCQHFHQFLESEEQLAKRFFHDIMSELDAFGAKKDLLAVKRVLSLDAQKTIDLLRNSLKRLDDRVATHSASRPQRTNLDFSSVHGISLDRFPVKILNPIEIKSGGKDSGVGDVDGVKSISLEYLVELEKNPWRYQQLFSIDSSLIEGFSETAEKVKISDAIGERRYRSWKSANERTDGDDGSMFSDDMSSGTAAVDLGSLLAYNSDETSLTTDTSISEEPVNTDAQRRIADAKDRDILRRCLERANVSNPSGKQNKSDSLRDLVSGAETALRNPSARRFLLTVLSKLSKAQKETAHDTGRARRRSGTTGPSKLEGKAFDTLVRLGCAMLDACMEDRDFNSAYSLLKLTAGLYCSSGDGDNASVTYMTQKMGHHPIYADLGVWEKAKEVHLAAKKKDSTKQSSDDEAEANDDEYEAAVATLYEMLGYGIPAEELARFASRVSENSGWFRSERGQSLLLLARRICMRRDQGESTNASKTSDLEMMSPSGNKSGPRTSLSGGSRNDLGIASEDGWLELGWAHPAAQSSRRLGPEKMNRVGSNPHLTGSEIQRTGSESSSTFMKRSAITTMAYLGSSVVATGGLDGGVFLARKVKSPDGEARTESGVDPCDIRGVHLDWGSSGSRYAVGSSAASLDGEYGVGAVSCLAATRAANQSYQSIMMSQKSPKKDTVDSLDDEDVLKAMEGARVVAGTTCGDLRVWSVKDVLSAVFYANHGGDFGGASDTRTLRGEGTSSTFLSKRKGSGTDYAAGSSLTRLKFSLRGRALSGHRGGVSCVDVPSYVYRPDSIISGGADGLIKLWSLRTSGAGRRSELDQGSMLAAASKGSTESMTSKAKSSRTGDALSILSGHGGRILCIKTAWHGDRLLSGGADRTVRVWDLAGSGGKCLHSLSGHFGWVTSVQYWGPNTIISASTDRSIALWDARVRNSPLFALRHHNAPVSSVLVGTRTDPIMVSAASDGTIAAWDFRHLSDAESGGNKLCKVVRSAAAKLYLHDFTSRQKVCGPVHLSRGPNVEKRSILCVGRDAVVREWDIRTGDVMSEHTTGHCDTISTFSSFQGESLVDTQLETNASEGVAGTITTSWDGTVRMRTQVGRR